MAARSNKASLEVQLSFNSLMVILAWVFFIVGVVLLLPLNVSVLGLTPTVCFLGGILSKALA